MTIRLYRRKLERFAMSASWALLLVGPAVLAAAIAIWAKTADDIVAIPDWIIWPAIAGICLLSVQAWAEYKRRTYDLNWIFKYDERFSSADMKKARAKAAQTVTKFNGQLGMISKELADIDDILDFFDELGFNERGGQITPEVLHQNFHYWIRGYYIATRDYIEAWQRVQKSRWEYVRPLYEIVEDVSKKRNPRSMHKAKLAPDELEEFLEFERKLSVDHD